MALFIEIKKIQETGRIELHFIKLPDQRLSNYLKGLGFRVNTTMPLVYYAPLQPAYQYLALTLKDVLENGEDYYDIEIKASYAPDDSLITFNKFSYAIIKFDPRHNKEDRKYVIFDQHISIAKALAAQYVNKHFAGKTVTIMVTAKTNKRYARKALELGHIIGGNTYVGAQKSTLEPSQIIIPPIVIANQKNATPSLRNAYGVYTKETAKDRYQTIEIPIPKAAKYSASIGIVADEQDQFRYGVRQHKEFGDALGHTSPVTDISKQYPTKEEAIKYGLREIITTLEKLIEARDLIVGNQEQKNKQLQKALDSTLDFGISYGIDLIDQETETETTQVIQEDEHQKDLVKKNSYIIKQSWSSIDTALIEQLADFIKVHTQYLHLEYELNSESDQKNGASKIASAKLISDKDIISFQLLNKNELHISSHTTNNEGVNYGGSTMSKSKLTIAIKYMLSKPDSLRVFKKAVTDPLEISNATPQKIAVQPLDEIVITSPSPKAPEFKTVPAHIFIPKGVKQPFDTMNIDQEYIAWLKVHFKTLFELTNDTLSSATALQLFMLMQLSHPTDYGVKVDRSELLTHWKNHGSELFEKLGYSTHPYALYANGIVDFIEVTRLQDLLNAYREPNWGYIIENYRFIKDTTAATDYLKAKKKALTKELESKAYRTGGFEYAATYNEELTWKITTIEESIDLLKNAIKEQEQTSKPPLKKSSSATPSKSDVPLSEDKAYTFFSQQNAAQIRTALQEKHLPMPFTGGKGWEADCTPLELMGRWETTWDAFEKMYQKPLQLQLKNREKLLLKLKGKPAKTAHDKTKHLNDLMASDKKRLIAIEHLVHDEFLVFQDELFEVVLEQTKKQNYRLNPDSIADFKEQILDQLLEQQQIESYKNEPIQTLLPKLLKWYFEDTSKAYALPERSPMDDERQCPDYMAKVIAYMSDAYMEARRMTKKNIENLMELTGTPNLGMLWEAVELSWLLWYKIYYDERIIFENRLFAMIRFWDNVQPTYAYSDSSKQLYKQYSTPCPIGAMIAQYTQMDTAASIFEPSAGNGLLLVGANPQKCHVNEIDRSRRQSLLQQDFAKVTHLNGAAPFPEQMTRSFDVVVTNPPFARWEEDKFDKTVIVKKYFDKHNGLEHHIRLEHMMAGLALHTMKNSGKAAIIIMGHTYFDERGYIAYYRPFFNWLYRNYRVADVININSYKMYNKQGAVKEVMLILIDGRKKKAKGAAPQFKDAPHLGDIENTFQELWLRIKSNIKTPLQNLIQQLKIANGHDIL